ncbi:MAG: Flp family type IVb pilin [Deltaproteobacteria bacterium]|nr:Flp family type IVb pilin [Deltaproteobacteria bacterium]MBW2388814.1 Flp family type IVb pilin [Deltaproteobacteria bacterium]
MLKMIRNFARDEDGLEMVEWAIVGALILTAAASAITSLSASVSAKFNDLDTLINGLP